MAVDSGRRCNHWKVLDDRALRNAFSGHARLQARLARGSAPCRNCDTPPLPLQDLWLCLHCLQEPEIRCAARHAESHYHRHGHKLCLNLGSRRVWCHSCGQSVQADRNSSDLLQAIQRSIDSTDDDGGSYDDYDNNHSNNNNNNNYNNNNNNNNNNNSNRAADRDRTRSKAQVDYRALFDNAKGGRAGLQNLGNTCYMNAALQCLLHCPPLLAFLLDRDPHTPSADGDSVSQQRRTKLVNHVAELSQKSWSGGYTVCAPRALLKDVWALNSFFRGYGQQDSQELLRCLLDHLDEGLRIHKRPKPKPTPKPPAGKNKTRDSGGDDDNDDDDGDGDGDGEKKSHRELPSSVIGDIFQGKFCSSVTCKRCGHVSSVSNDFYDLSLELPEAKQLEKVGAEKGERALTANNRGFLSNMLTAVGITSAPLSLVTCLHSFCTSEQLTGEERYKCEKCKIKVDAVKSMDLSLLPEVLCVHLKRFSHGRFFGNKIGRHVSFPLTGLDMGAFVSNSPDIIKKSKSRKQKRKDKKKQSKNNTTNSHTVSGGGSDGGIYDLFGLIRHIGSAGGGHYVAYAMHHVTGDWFKFDDRSVTPVSPETVAKQEAYVLFYRRRQQHRDKADKQTVMKMVQRAQADASSNPAVPRCYLSRRWLKKLDVLTRVSCVDNRDLCCPHGVPRAIGGKGTRAADEADAAAVLLTRQGYRDIVKRCGGGGPLVDGKGASVCEECELPSIRRREMEMIQRLDEQSRHDDHAAFCLIHAGWLKSWRKFINGELHDRPGPIPNNELLELRRIGNSSKGRRSRSSTPTTNNNNTNNTRLVPVQGLVRREDYTALHMCVWKGLLSLYGGGPPILRHSLDIYSEEFKLGIDDRDDTPGQV